MLTGGLTLFLFLAYNLLAYMFETMKHVVNGLIGYTQEGSKFVFGTLGAPEVTIPVVGGRMALGEEVFASTIQAGVVVGNLPTEELDEAEIELTYAQLLSYEQGRIRLVVPTTIAPRW